MSVENLEELVEKLHGAIGQLEEAQEVVGEAAIDIRNEVERLHRATAIEWSQEMTAINVCLDYSSFRGPIDVSRVYVEADSMMKLCGLIGMLDQPKEPDVNAS